MLTKNQIKEIRSLESKKNRTISGLFIAEGKKLITELITSKILIDTIITIEEYSSGFQKMQSHTSFEIMIVPKEVINKISLLKSPQGCIALCKIPTTLLPEHPAENNIVFCLDDIQDPGNLGTIVRLANWFGMNDIICSPSSADIYNPKVVQATMGALSRVHVHYTPLKPFLESQEKWNEPVFGTFLDGEDLYRSSLHRNGIIVMGNEGKGISEELVPYIKRKITIPHFQFSQQKPDSLNVSIAAAIIVSEFMRRSITG
jgi:RNA methyltransferase, TrmH family